MFYHWTKEKFAFLVIFKSSVYVVKRSTNSDTKVMEFGSSTIEL